MRQVARFEDEQLAKRFADVLCARDIETEVSRSKEGAYFVWVLEEDHVETARAAFALFDANPDSPDFSGSEGCVERRHKKTEAVERKSRHTVIDVRRRYRAASGGPPRITLVLVAASVLVTLVTTFERRQLVLSLLSIGPIQEAYAGAQFHAVLHGEPWRLVTPIFVHYGVLHILFNMWWLVDLGGILESRIGGLRYALLVLATAALSNAAQYAWTGSPAFGGMSGVLYALFGYLWARGRLDPTFGAAIPPNTAVILLLWLALGFTGWLGNVANVAHLGGLVTGVGFGAIAAGMGRR